MAELDGRDEALGGEGGGEEPKGTSGSADAVAVAVALDAARYDPDLSKSARAYLERQGELLDLQIKHFDEEHRLAIAAMHRRSLIDRLRISLQLLIAVIVATAFIGLAVMVASAINDHGVVIDALSVPANLAEQGFTGEAMARQILDRLAELNRSSTTVRAASSYANNLSGDLKLEIPETGVSIGELSRMLHERLGHSTHIGGEITHIGDSISVRIRIGDDDTVESTGAEANLASLVRDAATKIYAKTQPYRYGYWLDLNGDDAAAATIFRRLAVTGSPLDRIWALHGLAIISQSDSEAIAYDQQALELDPGFPLARLTLSQSYYSMGHDELGLKESRAVIAAAGEYSQAGLSRHGLAGVRAGATLDIAEDLGDYVGALAAAGAIEAAAESTASRTGAWRVRITSLINLHDRTGAAMALALLPTNDDGPSLARRAMLQAASAAEQNDWRSVAANLEQARVSIGNAATYLHVRFSVRLMPLLAEAYARTGRDAEAAAVLAGIPADAYDGWCARGQVASVRRDFVNADKAFAEAVRQGPSIPRGYFLWGQMLVAKGDLTGGMLKYAEANRRGPQWAEPLKAWGDALLAQGHIREALDKYDLALKRAPRWEELKAERDRAAGQKDTA